MKNTIAVFKREFRAYFDSPVAYVFLTAFLVLAGFLTFGVAMFYERRQADLTPFFFWHPWVYLLLVPAATMGLWADERRNGTAELLLTLPVTIFEVLVGKFLAAWSFRRHRPRADVPGRSHGRLPRLARLGRRVLRLSRLAPPRRRGRRNRRLRVDFVAFFGGRVRRVARARLPAPHHRV